MANKNIIIAPKFTPFTFRELVEPIMAASKAQEEAEEKYSILDDAVSYWESLKDSNVDKDTYQTYKNFKKKFDESRNRLLNEGLNEAIRKDLMGIRSSYNSTIKPLEAAFKKREELIKEQRQYDAQNKGTLIYKKGTKASEIPLSQLVKNPAYTPDSPISGALLAQQGAEVFKNLAKEVAAGNKTVLKSLGLPYQYQTRTQVGMSSDDVIKAILRREDANQKLTSLADMIISSAGIDKNVDPEAYNKAWNYVAPSMMNAIGGTSVGSASDSYGADIARTTYSTGLGLKAAALQAEIAAPGTYGVTPEGAEWIASISKELGVVPPAAKLNPNEHAMGGFMNQSGDNPPRGSVDAGIKRYLESMKRLREQRQQQNNNNEAGNFSETQLPAPTPIIRSSRSATSKPTEEEKEAEKKQKAFTDYLQKVNAYGTWEMLFGKNQNSDLIDRLKRTNEFYYEKGGKYYMDSRIVNWFSEIEKALPKDKDGNYYIVHKSKYTKNKEGVERHIHYASKDPKKVLKKLYDNPEDWVYYIGKDPKNGNERWGDLLGNNEYSRWDHYIPALQTDEAAKYLGPLTQPIGKFIKNLSGNSNFLGQLAGGHFNPWSLVDPRHAAGHIGAMFGMTDSWAPFSAKYSSYADIRELKRAGITFDELYGKNKGIMGNKWRDYYHKNKEVGDIYGTSAYRIPIKPGNEFQSIIINKELSPMTRKKIESVYFDGETAQWKSKETLDYNKVMSGNPEVIGLYATPHGAVIEIKWDKDPKAKNKDLQHDFIQVAGGQGTDDVNRKLVAMGEFSQILNEGKIPLMDTNGNPQKDKRGKLKFSKTKLPAKTFLNFYHAFKDLEEQVGENAVRTLWPLGQ